MQGITTNAKQANTGVIFVTFESNEETITEWIACAENGARLFSAATPEPVTDYLEMIGATEINDLTWEIDGGTLSEITNGAQ